MRDSRIFNAAVKLSPERRGAYLDQACQTDSSLRGEVESLLKAHEDPGSFLQSRPAQPLATSEEGASAERLGTLIGPYKLLQQIGEGGMGVVYMAEQQAPVRRKIALKVIKPGMDSAQVIARFEAERQALAMMEHQNIAKVLDAGTTESERPYFVMELVHGVPLTKYCDDRKLTPRQRLELFIPVCHAVQHAHQKGIIHRDLKPSNILVTMYDDLPVPKVIDFGVAKAVEQRLTEKTLFTQFGTLVGTFEYMSPEQAEPNAFGVDTRSDIYSLGVLLYELLTGSTPLEQPRLRAAAYGEIVRLIKEEEAPRPSTRLSSSGAALAGISHQRGSEPGQLTKLVRGELDWIVMRCLEKNRTRRYETANGLARDVERYLRDEPVEACPPTAGYKLRKFARTHRRLLATAAAFAALLVLGVTASTWQAVRATQAEAVALANEQKANEHAAQTEKERDEVKVLSEKLQRTLYAAHMNLARHAWEEAGVPRVAELLDQHRPKPGEPDLRGFEWHYLQRLCHSELLTLKGHTGEVLSVAFSPDGKRLASGSGSWSNTPKPGEVKVWDAQTGEELLTFKGHTGRVNSVAFSPDGKHLASSGGGGTKLWEARTGQELLTLKDGGSGVAFSWDGKRLASGADDNTVKVWDAQTGQELLTCKGHTAGVSSVVFSPDGKRLASASFRGIVKVWDAQTGQELISLNGTVYCVAFSPDGQRLASGDIGKVGEVKVWNAQTGQELLTLKGPPGWIDSVSFSPDGQRLASGSWLGTLRIWDLQTGQELRTFKGGGGSVAFSPDGQRLASNAADKTVKVWDAHKDQENLTLPGDREGNVAFSSDSRRLASASRDSTVKVWDAQTGQLTLTLKGHTVPVWRVAFSPDGKRLASGGPRSTPGARAEVKVWDAETGQERLSLQGLTGSIESLAFSPDGKRLASASADNTVKVWDAQTGQELLSLKGAGFSVAFSPDGKRLASASREGVKVWNAQTGQELLTLKGAGGSVAFSPDGKRLASVSPEGVKVWDAQTGQELLSLKGQVQNPPSVVFSPDGKHLASSTFDETVKVWDAQTGQELPSLKAHTGSFSSVAFSPDGRRLASGNRGTGEVKIWDAQTGQELLSLKGGSWVVFSPDGHRLASGRRAGPVTIWDATPLPEKP